jgi:threonine dehydratase
MPQTTPLVKIAQTRRWGAEVELHGESFDEAFSRAEELRDERRLTFVHPFDDPAIIAGQGTVALELAEQVPDLEVVVSPIGGGGLASGVAVGIRALVPAARIYGIQTEAAPAMAESVRAGAFTPITTRRTIAEGIAVKRPGKLTLEHVRALVDDVVVVAEGEIESAVFRLLEAERLVTEGAGAATYAAVRRRLVPDLAGRKVVVILSGANIDLNMVGRLIERSLVRQHRLTRLRLTIQDRPGALADVLAIVAASGANVLRVHHNRYFSVATLWETEIEMTLEIRDRDHAIGLLADLRGAGYERIEEPGLQLVKASLGKPG